MTDVVASDRVLLPYRHLRWRSTVVALLAAAVPACATTIGLALQGGDLVPALTMTGLLVAVAAVLTWRLSVSRIVLQPDGLQLRMLERFTTGAPRARVRRAVMRSIHAPDGLHVSRHLFLLDEADRTLFRMSDRWWTEEQIGRVARHFEVPLESQCEAVQLSELRRTVPHQLYWHERHSFLARLGISAGAFAVCLVVAALAVASL